MPDTGEHYPNGTTKPKTDEYEVKAVFFEVTSNMPSSRYTIFFSADDKQIYGAFWANRSADEVAGVAEVFDRCKNAGIPCNYKYSTAMFGPLLLPT